MGTHAPLVTPPVRIVICDLVHQIDITITKGRVVVRDRPPPTPKDDDE